MDKNSLRMTIDAFLPHGMCLSWKPSLLVLHLTADLLIAAAYFSIPFALIRFVRLRGDLVYPPIFYLFSAFILACGVTHVFDVWVIWRPDYVAQGIMKSLTAVISVLSAIFLWPAMSRAMALPSHQHVMDINADLNREIMGHRESVARLSEEVERREEAQSRFESLNQSLEKTVNERARQLDQVSDHLRKSEERLRMAIEASGVGFSDADLESNKFFFFSPSSALIYEGGFEGSGETPSSWNDRMHPDDKKDVLEQIQTCLKERKTYEVEYRIQVAEGEFRWILERGRALEYNSHHNPTRVISTHLDINFRKLTELHNQQLAAIIENSSDLIGHADINQKILYLNAAGRSMLGIQSQEELDHVKLYDFQPEWAKELIIDVGIPFALTHSLWQGDTAFLQSDGSEIPVSQLILIQKNPRSGAIDKISTVCRDISDRIMASKIINQQKETLELAVNGARMGIWNWNIVTNDVEVSDRHREIFGIPESLKFTYDDFLKALYPDDRESTLKAVKKALEEGRDYDVIYRIVRPDHSIRWISAIGRGYFDETGTPIRMIGVSLDITDRKFLEDELHRNLTELESADRRKDEFIALLAHELRNPLAPIKMVAHLLTAGGLNAEKYQWCCESLSRQTHHLSKLVDDLLEVSRISRGLVKIAPEVVDIGSVIQQAEEISGPQINKLGHHYTVEIPDSPVFVSGDRVRLIQVISNLLNNAAKFTEPGGKIDLKVTQSQGLVNIIVSDNGIGMSRQSLDHVFDLFSQITPTGSKGNDGLGIGLYLSKQLVLLHGGDLYAQSEGIGKGAEFRVRLASAEQPSEVQSNDCLTALALPCEIRVLIVDDNTDAAESLQCYLEIRGFMVEKTFDGMSALSFGERFKPNIILLDIGMPGMNGYETCQQIRSKPWGKNVLIVAVSGWGQSEDMKKSAVAGFDHHLVKPIDLETLNRLLQQHVGNT